MSDIRINKCADCKYHTCNSVCLNDKKSCNGFCSIVGLYKFCDCTICRSFELDKYLHN